MRLPQMLALLFPFTISVLRAQDASDLEVFSSHSQVLVREVTGMDTAKSFTNATDALDYALKVLDRSGGSIALRSGSYPLTRMLTVPSNVLIKGSGRATRIMPQKGVECGIRVNGDGAVIEDLALYGNPGQTGLILEAAGDCHVHGVTAQGFDYGFWVRQDSFLVSLTDCAAADCAKAGFFFDNLRNGRGGDFVPNLVSNCMAYGGGTGFEANHAIVLNFVGCISHQNHDYGFYFHDGSFSVSVTGCRTFQAGKDALREENSGEINASSNIFCWTRGNGIVLKGVSWGTLAANNVIDNGVRTADGSFRDGIVLEKSNGIQITGNALFNYGDQCPMKDGIVTDSGCVNINIVSNNINYFVGKGIISEGTNIVVANNIAYGEHSYRNEGRKPYPDFDSLRLNRFLKSEYPSANP